jgi:hypothetical protein
VYAKGREREREKALFLIYTYIEKRERNNSVIRSIVMNSSISDNKNSSLWTLITTKPLYIIIPNLFIIRPSRFLFNYYIKPAKFLVIILPRNIWKKGKIYQWASVG